MTDTSGTVQFREVVTVSGRRSHSKRVRLIVVNYASSSGTNILTPATRSRPPASADPDTFVDALSTAEQFDAAGMGAILALAAPARSGRWVRTKTSC